MNKNTVRGRGRETRWLKLELLVDDGHVRDGENEGEFDELVESVRARGVLQPILIDNTRKCNIVDGRRRLRAAAKCLHDAVPCYVADDLSPGELLAVVREANTCRLEMTRTEKQLALEAEAEAAKAEAAKRQAATRLDGKTKGGKPRRKGRKKGKGVGGGKLPPPKSTKGKARDALAKRMKESPRTVQKRVTILKAAAEAPMVYAHLRKLLTEQPVDRVYKELRRLQAAEAKADGRPVPPDDGAPTTEPPTPTTAPNAAGEAASTPSTGATAPGDRTVAGDPSPSPAAIPPEPGNRQWEVGDGLAQRRAMAVEACCANANGLLNALRGLAALRPTPAELDRLSAALEPLGDLFAELVTADANPT